jgi:hypothetical protein
MNKILFAVIIAFTVTVSAGDLEPANKSIQARVVENLKSNNICERKISRYREKVQRYQNINDPTPVESFKLTYYKERLQYWTEYCAAEPINTQ